MDELWQAAMRWSGFEEFQVSDSLAYESIVRAAMKLPIPTEDRANTHWRDYIKYLYDLHKPAVEAELIKMRLKNG